MAASLLGAGAGADTGSGISTSDSATLGVFNDTTVASSELCCATCVSATSGSRRGGATCSSTGAATVGFGFSTSRTLNHRTSDGQPTPTLTASEKELTGIAMALGEAGKGVLQFVSDFNDPQKEAAMLRRIVERSGRPLSVSLASRCRTRRLEIAAW